MESEGIQGTELRKRSMACLHSLAIFNLPSDTQSIRINGLTDYYAWLFPHSSNLQKPRDGVALTQTLTIILDYQMPATTEKVG